MQEQLKILVVDDILTGRLAVQEAVHSLYPDAVIGTARSCHEATEAILSHPFDCVFLDHSLADGGGMTCIIDVREAGITTPIVLLTDQDDESLVREALNAGATDYLPKAHITPHLLGHCLRSALRYHEVQRQARQAQDDLRLRDRAITAASNGIVIADPHQPDCPIIYCNPAFTAITGYTREETLGHNCRFLQGEGTDDRYVQQVRDCLRQETDCQIVLRNFKKDGTPFWNELSLSPVRDAGGRLTHFIGVQTDITQRRDAEDALRQNMVRQQTLLRDMFASVTEGRLTLCGSGADLPPPLTWYAGPIPLSRAGGVRELRRQTLGACMAAGLPDQRRYDLETAAGEAGMNAVVHAGTGTGHLSMGEDTIQVRVEDAGAGIAVEDLPNATLRRGYTTAGTMGHGFKMILKTVDRVFLLTGNAGTTIVIEQDKAAPLPVW